MSASGLIQEYDRTLEQQILARGSCLACRDEQLSAKVEELLRDSDPREVHRLGLDPLRVMEESLAAASAAAYGRRGGAKRGLQGLAKAFEVLEQAALNLYLGPWREEYKLIKMYSGTFTHFISPVLSMPQTEKVFGLLGYQPSPSRPQQLRLQSPRVSPASLEDLLRLSCAFFLARCECRLLLSALGKRAGDGRWELAVVRERARGISPEVAVDIAEKQMEPMDGELDLYREEESAGGDDAPPGGGERRRNGPADSTRSSSFYRGRRSDQNSSQQVQVPGPDGSRSEDLCSCLRAPPLRLHRCFDCRALHDITCVKLAECSVGRHRVEEVPDGLNGAAISPADPEPPTVRPISYHCEAARAEPQLVCLTCHAFHGASCVQGKLCRSTHQIKRLGTCSCGKACSRTPLVLCHYCGNEFCRECWYKNPVTCSCGQTFDLSTSV